MVLQKLKNCSDFWKKFVVFCLLAILAALLFLLVGHNFSKEINNFDKQKFYQVLKLDKLKQVKDNVSSQMEQQEKDFTEGMKKLQEMEKQQATSTVATSSENATTATNY